MSAPHGKTIATAFLLAALHIGFTTHAQTNCSFENLKGRWKEVASFPGQPTNIDSLKELESNSRRAWGLWNFKEDKTYEHRHPLERSKYKRNGVYVLKESSCEIILGTRSNAHEKANLEVLYLDNNHLIYKSDNNPKGYFTHVLVRSTN